MELEIERLAFDSLRNLGEVAEPVKQKGPCDYAQRAKGKVTNMMLAWPAGARLHGLEGQGKEFSLDSKSSGEWFVM